VPLDGRTNMATRFAWHGPSPWHAAEVSPHAHIRLSSISSCENGQGIRFGGGVMDFDPRDYFDERDPRDQDRDERDRDRDDDGLSLGRGPSSAPEFHHET
jgi:hypothetical protein